MSSSVSFGKRNRIRFSAGGALAQWRPPSGPAVYAVTYRPDAINRPGSHSVIYFGETPDLQNQSQAIREDLGGWWDENGGTNSELFIFIHEMPGSNQHERVIVQHQLVLEYEPRGNN